MPRNRFWVVPLLAVVAGCGGNNGGNPPAATPTSPAAPAAPPTVAFTLTAEELFAAYDQDRTAFKAKYAGKWVELSGVVHRPRVASRGSSDLLLVGKTPKPGKFDFGFVSITPSKAEAGKYDGLKALAKGQAVTVRGEVQEYGQVTKCEFVKVGPSTAVPTTPSELLAALFDDATRDKFLGKDVVLRGEVRKANWNGTIAHLDVADPGAKDGPLLEASINPNDQEHGKELAKLPVNSVVILIGEAQAINDGRIWDFRVLQAPPEGVTLPEAPKK